MGSVGVKAVKALGDITNRKPADRAIKTEDKPRGSRRERGPPSDGVPSKTKVMVANIPFDMTEEKVGFIVSLCQACTFLSCCELRTLT